MPVVSIVSIFTRGARSSETPELRNARVESDIRRSNEVWNTGFPPGVSCGITFVSQSLIYRPEVTIDAGTVSNSADPRIVQVIDEARAATNFATAIYVVYLSGETFDEGHVGNAGAVVESFADTNNYRIYGRCALSDGAYETYLLAHEVGHVLFFRFTGTTFNSWTAFDPSNPGNPHNSDPQNIMFPIVPARNPFLNGTQCAVARQSRAILENTLPTGFILDQNAASTSSGFAPQNQSNSFENLNTSLRGEPCDCKDHRHHPRPHNKPRIVKELNEQLDCFVQDLGPERAEIYPRPPKKKKDKKEKEKEKKKKSK